MKTVFLFFAALNIAFFLWQSSTIGSITGGGTKKQLAQDHSVATLVLLREAQAIKKGSGSNTSKTEDTQTALLDASTEKNVSAGKKYAVCYQLGPFDEPKQLTSVTNQLQSLGADTFQRKETRQIVLGHWVFLPSFPSWQDAKKKVTELEKKGITDIFILGRGEMKNSVSLGLFKNEDSAKRRVAHLGKLGVKPRVETQQTTKEVIWLDINVLSDKEKARNVLDDIAKADNDLKLKTRACQ
jgi:hypothetical protein